MIFREWKVTRWLKCFCVAEGLHLFSKTPVSSRELGLKDGSTRRLSLPP